MISAIVPFSLYNLALTVVLILLVVKLIKGVIKLGLFLVGLAFLAAFFGGGFALF